MSLTNIGNEYPELPTEDELNHEMEEINVDDMMDNFVYMDGMMNNYDYK